LLNDMETGNLQVPRFQREFVWPLTKTRELLDSIYKEFPIGTFFLWRAPAGSQPLYRPLGDMGIPEPKPGMPVSYILDGQQRLASLYVAIKGIRVEWRDYGRICIDLETATQYDQKKEEDSKDEIFVYRSSDNRRYVAVKDLVGPDNLTIYNNILQNWQPAFNKASNLLRNNYPFSVVWIQEQTLEDAIVIFQRINQAGQRLSRYDLVCANVWTDDFDLRKRVADLNRGYALQGFGAIDETIFTQTFALILKDQCTTVAELSLETDEILGVWTGVLRALHLAIDFVVNNLGVRHAEYLPYSGIIVVLAYYFYHAPTSAITAKEREALWNWFWRVTLSERYSATSPSRMAEDAKKLRTLIDGQEVVFNYPSTVTPESVARTRMTSTTSSLRNAALCMLALKQPRNLKDGSPVNLKDSFFSNLKSPERHHVFPVGYLRSRDIPATQVHLLPNFCLIPADLNREISNRAPAQYFAEYQSVNPEFAAAAESHILPVAPAGAVWKNDFNAFIEERAKRIADELNRLLVGGCAEITVRLETPPVSEVDTLEIRLRDFIDHVLTAYLGPNYWKQAMPGDVIVDVKELIADLLSRHPYEDQAQFLSARRRLDFCDVSHYEKIILKNWRQFEGSFQRKEEFERHSSAYRKLRNCVQHNRKPTDIEQKNGEAAMLWFEKIIDKYEQMIATAEGGGDELEDQESQ